MGRAMISKSLVQFSVNGQWCVPSLFDLKPKYVGGNGNIDNGNLFQKLPCMHCHTQCPRPCSRPPLTHTSTRDFWTFMDKSGSVSCEATSPFSWVLGNTSFCLCPPRVYFPVLFMFWQLCGGVNGDLRQECLCHTQFCYTQGACS